MTIGIIVGSIREGRRALPVAQWVHELAQGENIPTVLLDLVDFQVPMLVTATPPMAAERQYPDPETQRWSKAVDSCSGFIFVTPEYNHGVPGVAKNAVDSLGPEWVGKPVAYVSYGGDGGVRAVEHWRQILGNFDMRSVRQQVKLSMFTDFTGSDFTPADRQTGEAVAMLSVLSDRIR